MSFPRYPAYKPSGVEWLGEVPGTWSIEKFRHLFEESSEKIEKEVFGDMLSVSGYRGIELKQYDDENRRRRNEDLVGYRVVRSGQLVVNTMWLNYAGLGFSELDGYVSPAYRAYWPRTDEDTKYLHYLLRSEHYVKGYTRLLTGVLPNSLQISRDNMMCFPVILPPKEDQLAIATFLDHETAKIDTLIAEQQRLIELLQEKRQAVISHAVTKGLNPDAPMKDSGVEWLGEVPEHWDVAPLKHHWQVTDCKHVTAEFTQEGYPLASIKEAQGRWIDLTNAKRTTDEFYTLLTEGNRTPEPGDLVFTRNATVGEVAEVPAQIESFALGQDVVILKKLKGSHCSSFAWYLLRSTAVSNQLECAMIGSTFRRINVEQIKAISVPIPPSHEQASIAIYLGEASDQWSKQEQDARHCVSLLQERRSALISAAVTGQINVRGLVSEVEAA